MKMEKNILDVEYIYNSSNNVLDVLSKRSGNVACSRERERERERGREREGESDV